MGQCSYGDKCKYSHAIAPASQPEGSGMMMGVDNNNDRGFMGGGRNQAFTTIAPTQPNATGFQGAYPQSSPSQWGFSTASAHPMGIQHQPLTTPTQLYQPPQSRPQIASNFTTQFQRGGGGGGGGPPAPKAKVITLEERAREAATMAIRDDPRALRERLEEALPSAADVAGRDNENPAGRDEERRAFAEPAFEFGKIPEDVAVLLEAEEGQQEETAR